MTIRIMVMVYCLSMICSLGAMTREEKQPASGLQDQKDQKMDEPKNRHVTFAEDVPEQFRTMFKNIDTLVNLTKTVWNTRKSCRGQMTVIYTSSRHEKDPRLLEQWNCAHVSRGQFVRDANALLNSINHKDFVIQMREWLKNIGFDMNHEGPYMLDDFFNDAHDDVLRSFEMLVNDFKASLLPAGSSGHKKDQESDGL